MKQIRKTLFLIDGHSLCYRSFYAIRELATSKGEPTNAVYGFVNTFRKILREFNPDYMVVCFDSKEKTHRAQKYIQYKIQRPMMPENLIKQIPIIKDAIDAFNVKTCEVPGYEADDIIATLTQNAMKEEIDVVIVTEDKDMYQLANEHTKFFSASKDQMFSQEDVAKKLGFDPKRIIDFIALAGDASDNIPGVKGIGEVTAKQLIDRFGDLESILKNAQKVESSKIREKLIDQTQIAQLSKELATLDYDVPLDFKLEDVKVHSPNQNRLHNLFKDLEFRRLADEFIERKIEDSNIEIHQLKIASEFKDLILEIKKINKFGYQIIKEEEIVYICINNKNCYQFGIKDLEKLKEVFIDEKILKITYNCKEMYKFLSFAHIESSLNTFDVLLAGYLVSPTQTVSDISQLTWSYLKKSLPQESNKVLYETAFLIELEKVLTDELKQKEIYDLYKNIEKPLAYVLSKIESYGVKDR